MDANNKEVGFRIKSIRQKLGKTTKEFGLLVDGASDSLVSRWERGVNFPNVKRLTLIAKLGEISVNELLYGSFDNFARDYIERLTYDDNWAKAFRITDEKRKEIILKTIEQVFKNGLAKHFYDIGEFSAVRKNLFDEMSKTAWRIDSETEFTNLGALNRISMDVSEMMKNLEEYHNNGVDSDVYTDIESVIEDTHENLISLYEKYKDRLKK